jgi:hypothetical protein
MTQFEDGLQKPIPIMHVSLSPSPSLQLDFSHLIATISAPHKVEIYLLSALKEDAVLT